MRRQVGPQSMVSSIMWKSHFHYFDRIQLEQKELPNSLIRLFTSADKNKTDLQNNIYLPIIQYSNPLRRIFQEFGDYQ